MRNIIVINPGEEDAWDIGLSDATFTPQTGAVVVHNNEVKTSGMKDIRVRERALTDLC